MTEPVKMKTRKPSNEQPKAIRQAVVVQKPNLEDLVIKRMQAMRDANNNSKRRKEYKLLFPKLLRFSNIIY